MEKCLTYKVYSTIVEGLKVRSPGLVPEYWDKYWLYTHIQQVCNALPSRKNSAKISKLGRIGHWSKNRVMVESAKYTRCTWLMSVIQTCI